MSAPPACSTFLATSTAFRLSSKALSSLGVLVAGVMVRLLVDCVPLGVVLIPVLAPSVGAIFGVFCA